MRSRTPMATAAVALSLMMAVPTLVGAQEAEDAMASADTEVLVTRTGTVEIAFDDEGRREYYLVLGDGSRLELDVGPPWYLGEDDRLAGLVGREVEVVGSLGEGPPVERIPDVARERSDPGPSIDVYIIDGERVREPGRPPWAGGPAVVGESHPGYDGWSQGRAKGGESA